jgi:hypothetical protein
MASGTALVACSSCSCHAFARETHCPGCGAPLRASDGSLQRTAGAALLGLTLAFTVPACTSETGSGSSTSGGGGGMGGYQAMSTYGVAVTGGGMGGYQTMSTYGVGPSSGSFGGAGGASSSTGGTGGAGGAGGHGGSK